MSKPQYLFTLRTINNEHLRPDPNAFGLRFRSAPPFETIKEWFILTELFEPRTGTLKGYLLYCVSMPQPLV